MSFQASLSLLVTPGWQDYELLDSGNGQKLERYGRFILARPEAEAIWRPALPEKTWQAAHARFIPSPEENGGHWETRQAMPDSWEITCNGLRLQVQTGASRHVGLFPEQSSQWDWIGERVRATHQPLRVLNLFGYTGAASLAAAQAGAQVTHVDASRKVVAWARQNQQLSGLEQAPIRWIVDDALKFVERENRRCTTYDGLILDPPKFGRGPKGEVWEFYKLIPSLLEACRGLLSPEPHFVILTAYAVKASALTLGAALHEILSKKGGQVTAGELALQEKSAGRLLSMAVYAAWNRGK